METVKMNMALFIRLLEMSREVIKYDEGIHFMAEIVGQLSKQNDAITMAQYPKILEYLRTYKILQ